MLILVSAQTGLVTTANPCDDEGRYFYLGQRLWDTGNLLDPFNNWRSAVTGGSLYLQSIGVQLSSQNGATAVDLAAGQVLLVAVVLSLKNWYARAALLIYAVLMAVTNFSGIGPTNSVPRLSPLLLMAGSLVVVFRAVQDRAEETVLVTAVAAAMAAAGAVRFQFLVFTGMTVFIGLVLTRRHVRLLLVASLTAALISPWLLASYRDAGTPLYPFFSGNNDEKWTGVGLPSAVSRTFLDRLLEIDGLRFLIATIFLAVLVWRALEPVVRKVVLAVSAGSLLTTALFALSAKANDQPDISRYVAPLLIAAMFVIGIFILESSGISLEKSRVGMPMLFLVVMLGLSTGTTGLLDFPSEFVSRISATARAATSLSPEPNRLDESLVKQIIKEADSGTTVLTAIDRAEFALSDRVSVGILGVPGWSYPRPHDLVWKKGLSPESDSFLVKFSPSDLPENKVLAVVTFGQRGRGDMIGIRRTPFGIEFVLDHWGSPLIVSPRWKEFGSGERTVEVDVDRTRGLVQFRAGGSFFHTMRPRTGKFHSEHGRYQFLSNELGFSTVTAAPSDMRKVRVVSSPAASVQFYENLLEGLRTRGVDYVLAKSSEKSTCLYNEQNWIENSVSPTIYQLHAPYIFAWFDLVDYLERRLPTERIGIYSLIDLRE